MNREIGKRYRWTRISKQRRIYPNTVLGFAAENEDLRFQNCKTLTVTVSGGISRPAHCFTRYPETAALSEGLK